MITLREVEHLAKLARLGLSVKELKKLQKELGSILGYVEKLGEANVFGIEPISHITGLKNAPREDEVRERLSDADEVLNAVPTREGRWVKVARVISKTVISKQNNKKTLITDY